MRVVATTVTMGPAGPSPMPMNAPSLYTYMHSAHQWMHAHEPYACIHHRPTHAICIATCCSMSASCVCIYKMQIYILISTYHAWDGCWKALGNAHQPAAYPPCMLEPPHICTQATSRLMLLHTFSQATAYSAVSRQWANRRLNEGDIAGHKCL